MNSLKCQLPYLRTIHKPLRKIEIIWQFRNRLKRMIKRRYAYIYNWLSEISRGKERNYPPSKRDLAKKLLAGDLVRVKTREEIQATLNRWNEMKGCGFMEEMWEYCGTTQRVKRRVERFIDETDYRVRNCSGVISLDGVMCQGTVDFGRCDRSCFFFWREEWLEKIEPNL